uniref:Replication timing regulatory factor 1 n=1 Tax=Takifugu rubripes TaxID=31033 RepID=A0A674N161_TAKRU
MAGPPGSCSFLPLLEPLEDSTAGHAEQIDAYLTIANRLGGEEARQFLPAVEQHFSRLGKAHISSPNAELNQAALQALGFCVYHSHVVSGFALEILSALCSLAMKSSDKNSCTRALWVISKQSFPADVIAKKVPSILDTLDSVWNREDVKSVVMEHEALNVIMRLLEQVPAEMGGAAVRWVKFVVPLVVHSASKVRLRAAATMEMGMPLFLEKQTEVAAVIEPMMSSKLIPELQKLFMTKNETNVLKLWPLFVKLLGKLLHKGGPFINSLLHLEELGFRSSSPTIKKIAFIAWKSLIDNFALNPDILCSSKRMKLLMQPLASIHVRTEALMLTKVEVWWYLVVQLGPNLSSFFDQVAVPLLQCTIRSDSSAVPGTPSRPTGQNGAITPGKALTSIHLNSSVQITPTFPKIQLLGLEMLLHYFLGPEVTATAAKSKLILSLEPLKHPLLSSAGSFSKHAAVLISNINDGFINVGNDAPESLLTVLWTTLVHFVNSTIESGNKKDRHGSEVLTLMLQALQSIVTSNALPADRVLILFETTVKGVTQRVLGSASYQVGKMDVLNGTPALFLILLLCNSNMIGAYVEDERFFQCLHTLVSCGLSGPTSPLAFAGAALGAIGQSAASLQNKEQLWRMWSTVVNPLTDTITQSNEVNQGDALEHNFSAIHAALMFPLTHLLGAALPQATQKAMLSSWSKLYKVFACCSALVATAEENICCEELCTKMSTVIDKEALLVSMTPHTPVNWMKKKNKVLGNLSTFQTLLVQCLQVYLEDTVTSSDATGMALVSILSVLFTNLALANIVKELLTSLTHPLTQLYKHAASETPSFTSQLLGKLEKLLGDVLGCLQTRTAVAYDDELLALLSPLLSVLFLHKSKHLRSSVTCFWNSTFANSVSLKYPDEIRPVLSQVKQKTPIILPGFEAVDVPDELSGQSLSENSQLETKLSGLPVSSVGKRESVLGRAAELNDEKKAKSVSTKLDFGSPKTPRRQVLEEEASIDFVFIPPETKERVLTEHQKEVKRTKRVDIPAMYNNLDASLDTTAFTQYTQSQEDSAPKENVEIAPTPKETGNVSNLKAGKTIQEDSVHEDMVAESAAVSQKDDAKVDGSSEAVEEESKEDTTPNISGSSDMVSGTPQKSISRRQSFITLEKYPDGKPASPDVTSTFTGPHTKSTGSQKRRKTNRSNSPMDSQELTEAESQDFLSAGKVNSQCAVSQTPESPLRPKGSLTKFAPVRLTERVPRDPAEEDDVIPDTQTGAEGDQTTTVAKVQSTCQEETSQPNLDDSQSAWSKISSSEPRRSGRNRMSPLLPGQDPDERDTKYQYLNQKRGDSQKSDSQNSDSSQSGPKTRSKQAAEEESSKHRLRSRSQREQTSSSQTPSQGRARKKIKLYSNSEEFLLRNEKPESRRRSRDSSQTASQSNKESQSQGRRSKGSLGTKEEGEIKKEVLENSQDSSQAIVLGPVSKKGPTDNETSMEDSWRTAESPEDCRQDSQNFTASPSNDKSVLNDTNEEVIQEDAQSNQGSKKLEATASDKSESKDFIIGQNTSSSQVTPPAVGGKETAGVRTRRSKAGAGSSSTPESSQSQGLEESTELSQGRSRYSRRRSSQALAASIVPSESETTEPTENIPVPKKRGRKPRASLQSPLTGKSPQTERKDVGDREPLKAEHKRIDDSLETQELLQEDHSSNETSQTELKADAYGGKRSTEEVSLQEEKQIPNIDHVFHETVTTELQSSEKCESTGKNAEHAPTSSLDETSAASEPVDGDEDQHKSPDQAHPVDPDEACHATTLVENQVDETEDERHTHEIEPAEASDETTSLQKTEEQHMIQTQEHKDEERTISESSADMSVFCPPEIPESAIRDAAHDSPSKLRDLEALMGPDVNHSPSSHVRGTWSPSASPSNSILKKSQKRPLEDEIPSPLVKSRRVSFADPIQQQETADDIDRRSPCIRTSSPRKPRNASSSQPKVQLVKKSKQIIGFLLPGYKSSKKCLISEMSQEPRPVSRDCVYPALVGCSAPVEAVLSQISSNMWSRGFGQLVRARNIKTVGDLSALTATEIKTLPIRSPKISNVKKALKNYEQQVGRWHEFATSSTEPGPDGRSHPEGLLPELESLAGRMESELRYCSSEQLVQIHERLGNMMKRVVVELQSRLYQTQGEPGK